MELLRIALETYVGIGFFFLIWMIIAALFFHREYPFQHTVSFVLICVLFWPYPLFFANRGKR